MNKKYHWLLFDLDNTLLDFSIASKTSLFKTFDDYGIMCTAEMYAQYKVENQKVWHRFEEKEIDTVELRKIRFMRFFEFQNIDIDPFEFNTHYLENLVEASEIYEGVLPLLERLRKNYKLSIVTNGLKEVQRPRLRKTGIYDFFDSIVVSDEIDVAKPDQRFFEIAHQSLEETYQKEHMLMIGDNIKSDIKGGKEYGLSTCWLSHHMPNNTSIQPRYTLPTVLELESVL